MIKMSTHEQRAGIIHIDFYLHSALLTQSVNHFYLWSFFASEALRDVNRLLTITLDISAFGPARQTGRENGCRHPSIKQPFIQDRRLI